MDYLCLEFINSNWYNNHKPFFEPLTDKAWAEAFCRKWELPRWDTANGHCSELLQLRGFLQSATRKYCESNMITDYSVQTINDYLGRISVIKLLSANNDKLLLQDATNGDPFNFLVHKIALSFCELITNIKSNRIKLCENPDCGWFFYDNSKNHTRKWCDNTCASLIKVRRHRSQASHIGF